MRRRQTSSSLTRVSALACVAPLALSPLDGDVCKADCTYTCKPRQPAHCESQMPCAACCCVPAVPPARGLALHHSPHDFLDCTPATLLSSTVNSACPYIVTRTATTPPAPPISFLSRATDPAVHWFFFFFGPILLFVVPVLPREQQPYLLTACRQAAPEAWQCAHPCAAPPKLLLPRSHPSPAALFSARHFVLLPSLLKSTLPCTWLLPLISCAMWTRRSLLFTSAVDLHQVRGTPVCTPKVN